MQYLIIGTCDYFIVNGDAEPDNPVMLNGGNFVPGPPPPVFQMMPNAPLYMGNVGPSVHGYVPSQISPYQQPMYPGPEPPMDPNHRRPNISRHQKGIPPPPNVKRNNDMAYRHPDNIEMANYQTQPTYIAVPPPHYYYSPQNSPLYLPPPHHGHPSYPMYPHPHPTMYNPYPQPPGPPMYHSPPAGQVPQQPLLVETCKPNINPIPSVHNIYSQLPENINEISVDSDIISVQDKELELQLQPELVNVDIVEVEPKELDNEKVDDFKEVPEAELIVSVEPVENIKEPSPTIKIKKKKELATNGSLDLIENNQISEKELENKEINKKEDLTSPEEIQEVTNLDNEQLVASVSIPPVKLEETEPAVKPVAKTWAGLFSGSSSTNNNNVFTLHGSSQPPSITNSEPVIMPSRSIPENTIRSSVFIANTNQKQTLPVKPRPSNNNSVFNADDNILHLQRLGG